MTPKFALDFEDIKANNKIEDVAERLGLELKKAGNQLRGPCFSGAEGDRKLVITPSKGLWYSFALDKGGDVIGLVAEVNNMSARDAAAWIVGKEPEKGRSERSVSESAEARGGFRALDYLQPDHPAVEAVGLEPDDIRRIGGGYAPRGVLKGTVALPIRDENGKLLGYVGCIECKFPSQWWF